MNLSSLARRAAPYGDLEEARGEIHRLRDEKSRPIEDHDFENSRSRVRVPDCRGIVLQGSRSMKLRIITSVAVAAGLALSLSACQKKADETAPAADAAATSADAAADSAAAAADAAAMPPADATVPPADTTTTTPATPPADSAMSTTTPEQK
jgi:hypothetical protein